MRTIWNEQRLQRLFWRYNRRFFGDALKGWTVDAMSHMRPFSGAVMRRQDAFRSAYHPILATIWFDLR